MLSDLCKFIVVIGIGYTLQVAALCLPLPSNKIGSQWVILLDVHVPMETHVVTSTSNPLILVDFVADFPLWDNLALPILCGRCPSHPAPTMTCQHIRHSIAKGGTGAAVNGIFIFYSVIRSCRFFCGFTCNMQRTCNCRFLVPR